MLHTFMLYTPVYFSLPISLRLQIIQIFPDACSPWLCVPNLTQSSVHPKTPQILMPHSLELMVCGYPNPLSPEPLSPLNVSFTIWHQDRSIKLLLPVLVTLSHTKNNSSLLSTCMYTWSELIIGYMP